MKKYLFFFFLPFLLSCRENILWIHLDPNTNKLLDPCNEQIILRGVNKMVVFDAQDQLGDRNFKEIAQTNANCVRIAWGIAREINKTVVPTTPIELDSIITKCSRHGMIPIIGLWDYTDDADGGFSKLDQYISFWIKPEITQVLQKHQGNIIINIANECGDVVDEDNLEDMNLKTTAFINAYSIAIDKIRKTGINCPIMIDGLDRGKSLMGFYFKRQNQTKNVGEELLAKDPKYNLIFSVHTYWPKNGGATESFIQNKFDEAIKSKLPFVVGELCAFGAGQSSTACQSPEGEVNYQKIAEICQANQIGWMAWEWGPGNDVNNPMCSIIDMTSDGNFSSLKAGWATDIIKNPNYGLLAQSKKNSWAKLGWNACSNAKDIGLK